MLVRKAVPADIPAVTAIYGALLDREERGELSTGWTRGVYPTEQTALDALAAGTLYVLEDGGRVAAAAKLDQNQMAQYSQCTWRHDAPPEQVLVLHTLELVFLFRHVRLYRGPLAISVILTLLFGLLHWKPLVDAKARGDAR